MIEIDGSYGEAGGQILRTAVALSCISGKPCKITNIRASRPQAGLKPQHLKGIETCAKICDADLRGANLGSTKIEFHPGKVEGGEYNIDIGTAGAISLILQTLIIPLIHADKKVTLNITGGTDVKWSPTMGFFEAVFCGNLKNIGINVESTVLRSGFYPKGGGKARVIITPCKEIKPINWVEQGEIRRVDCWSFSSIRGVAERQMKGFEKFFKPDCRDVQDVSSSSPGSSITAHVHCNTVIGSSALGERGKPAEKVGEECAELLKKQIDSGFALDEWVADQILPFMALAGGESRISVAEVTQHAKTNIWVIEKFLPVKFSISDKIISCRQL